MVEGIFRITTVEGNGTNATRLTVLSPQTASFIVPTNRHSRNREPGTTLAAFPRKGWSRWVDVGKMRVGVPDALTIVA